VALDPDAVALGAAGARMVLFAAGFARSADGFFGVRGVLFHGGSKNFITPSQIIPRQNLRPLWC
jgi:hypothetical protein